MSTNRIDQMHTLLLVNMEKQAEKEHRSDQDSQRSDSGYL